MTKVTAVLTILAASLAWMAVDSGARRSAIRGARTVVKDFVEELDARTKVRDLDQRLAEEEPEALLLAGYYHASERGWHPPALARRLERWLGSPRKEEGLRMLKRSAELGNRTAEWMHWNIAGWPEGEDLLEVVAGGSELAAWRLMSDLANDGCDVDDTILQELHVIAASLDGPAFPSDEAASEPASLRVARGVESIVAWKAESCAKADA